jgi:translation initiation factor 2 beta subunit (eIF-2beta)/eIF-5
MEKDYKAMLSRAYENLPDVVTEVDRFQIPRAIVRRQGRRSVIQNFKEIAERLQRPPEHLLKFLLRETLTPTASETLSRSTRKSTSSVRSAVGRIPMS